MNQISNFRLKFGKYKGDMFHDTPREYQLWLQSQPWFFVPEPRLSSTSTGSTANTVTALHKKLKGWNGHSRQGQAAYDALFEFEVNEPVTLGLECVCGCDKLPNEKYCCGDTCRYAST